MPFTKDDATRWSRELAGQNWQDRLAWVTTQSEQIAFSTSLSLEDQLITHQIATEKLPIEIFTLDTGRMFEEAYTLWQDTETRYGIHITAYHPQADAVEDYIRQNGVNGFYRSIENRKSCCFIRKVEPLNRALQGVEVWITGLRREHSDGRGDLPVAEWDESRSIIKLNPIIDLSQQELEAIINTENIPYNPLHDQGYPSIGCAPCTRAIEPGEHARAGRWWWEQDSGQECGLHVKDGKLVRVMPKESYAI